jgi:hypothetical protein
MVKFFGGRPYCKHKTLHAATQEAADLLRRQWEGRGFKVDLIGPAGPRGITVVVYMPMPLGRG